MELQGDDTSIIYCPQDKVGIEASEVGMNYQIIDVGCFGYTCPGKTTKDSARRVFVANSEVLALIFWEYLSTTVDAEKNPLCHFCLEEIL